MTDEKFREIMTESNDDIMLEVCHCFAHGEKRGIFINEFNNVLCYDCFKKSLNGIIDIEKFESMCLNGLLKTIELAVKLNKHEMGGK